MPNWKQLLDEVSASGSTYDVIRRKYISELASHTGRNVIVYYSGWLQKRDMVNPQFRGFAVDDSDKNGFMACIHGLDRTKGLDLILHTPGGDTAATESLVDYLRKMFGTNIRAIVPQLAMSAGTMIALACNKIVMGKHSSLGPIDPQLGGLAAHGVLEEFDRAYKDIVKTPQTVPAWQPILAKYHPTLLGDCQKAVDWSRTIAIDWLETGMFFPGASANATQLAEAKAKAEKVVKELADHGVTLSHARHFSADDSRSLGLEIEMLEEPGQEKFQDLVLTVHHACILTLAGTAAFKVIENQLGVAHVLQLTPSH